MLVIRSSYLFAISVLSKSPRGWVSLSSSDPSVTAFFKKVGDGHPLRLWKCVTEVEAPPMEVIQHIVNERPLWDAYLLKWRTIEQLDQDTDVFQYACGQPVTEYCVVRYVLSRLDTLGLRNCV